MKQKGQMLLILILIMTVALSIGLSIVQKSLVDVSTSSKVEQSSRAFSAAEAGIEKALNSQGNAAQNLDNNSSIAAIDDTSISPPVKTDGTQQDALQHPPMGKEEVAQFWLADYALIPPAPSPVPNPPPVFYNPPDKTIEVYWGNSTSDRPALEVTLVYYGTDAADLVDGATMKYRSRKWFLDDNRAIRTAPNGFDQVTCTNDNPLLDDQGVITNYLCKEILGDNTPPSNLPLPSNLMLMRARLSYNQNPQPVAIRASGTCGRACSVPPQSRTITSTGTSGETQRKVKLFQEFNVVPHYFDYAIFSAGPISK